ncbi:neuronal acetylcholine receptor subunit beta-3-like [Chelonus insularis]|uniref:neuronal acetylcholine receptor subunit beta-3-like n=1 Tax=Chelonus insularis TaxID=460826 RepID=UPI0015888EE6|nr:neuronal acetylcholine receptor subunit beta-3-like [Chelonus insularis]
MFKLTILVFILFTNNRKSIGLEFTCNDIESKSSSLRLKRHLFCDYDTNVRPSTDAHSTLNIGVQFIPKFIEFYEWDNSLDFHTWLILTWEDVHLHWNPDDFDHIDIFHVKSSNIWIPDFSVFNSGDLSLDQSAIPLTDCILSSNGTIQCAIAKVYTTHCPADFADWPYDKHNCTLHFGSWMHFSDEINFEFGNEGILMHEFIESHEWNVKISNLTKSSSLYRTELDSMVFLSVEIQRKPTRNTLIYITPAVVLMILSLISLWLDPCSIERIAVASTSFICHILCLFDLHWYLPTSAVISSPKILIFYESSLGIAAFTFVFTCLLRKIYGIKVPPPQWIYSTVLIVLNSPITQFLGVKNFGNRRESRILSDSENNEETSNKRDNIWIECANILEWLALVTISLTYAILLIVLLPASDHTFFERYIF